MRNPYTAFAFLLVLFPFLHVNAADKSSAYLLLTPKLTLDKDLKALPSSSVTYSKNRNGFLQRSGSLRTSPGGRISTYRRNKYGFEEKSGSLRPSFNKRRIEVFEKNKYGFEEKVGSMRSQRKDSPNLDVYRKNNYGFEEKVGSIK